MGIFEGADECVGNGDGTNEGASDNVGKSVPQGPLVGEVVGKVADGDVLHVRFVDEQMARIIKKEQPRQILGLIS